MEACPKCQAKNIVGVEYHGLHPQRYDGISEWMCLSCKYRQGRWTGKELTRGFVEPRLGRGGLPVPVEVSKK